MIDPLAVWCDEHYFSLHQPLGLDAKMLGMFVNIFVNALWLWYIVLYEVTFRMTVIIR